MCDQCLATHTHTQQQKKYYFYLLVNMTTNSEHLSNSSAKAVTPAHVCTHTNTHKHEPLGVTNTKKDTQHSKKAKWLGVRCLQIQTLGLK